MEKSKLYYIHYNLSKLRVCDYMEMPNNAIAVKSFIEFLEKPENKEQKQLFQLRVVADINEDDSLTPHHAIIAKGTNAQEVFAKYVSELEESDNV